MEGIKYKLMPCNGGCGVLIIAQSERVAWCGLYGSCRQQSADRRTEHHWMHKNAVAAKGRQYADKVRVQRRPKPYARQGTKVRLFQP